MSASPLQTVLGPSFYGFYAVFVALLSPSSCSSSPPPPPHCAPFRSNCKLMHFFLPSLPAVASFWFADPPSPPPLRHPKVATTVPVFFLLLLFLLIMLSPLPSAANQEVCLARLSSRLGGTKREGDGFSLASEVSEREGRGFFPPLK